MRTFQDVKADPTKLVDIGVEDLGEEADLGRGHGVVVREEELELEGTACCMVASVTSAVSISTRVEKCAPWYGEESGPSMVTSK